jgi:hypothetical protein
MQYIAWLREQAAAYHALAERWVKVHKPERAQECEELAETCEDAAENIEDHAPAG